MSEYPGDVRWAQEQAARVDQALALLRDSDAPPEVVGLIKAGLDLVQVSADAGVVLGEAGREIARLTERLGDAEESLRAEREDRARTAAALAANIKGLTGPSATSAERTRRDTYAHALELLERGAR